MQTAPRMSRSRPADNCAHRPNFLELPVSVESGRGQGAGRSRVVHNVALNLFGQGAPLAVAYFAIPALTGGLGTERFGVLTLAWAVLGYVSFFDLGLGRALTQAVAERMGRGDTASIAPVVKQALWWMLGLGAVGAAVLAALAPLLVSRGMRVSPDLVTETRDSFYLLAGSVPIVILTAGLRGVLEALGRFGLVNALRVPMGVLTFLAPLAVLQLSAHLPVVVAVLLIARVLALAAHAWVVARELRLLHVLGPAQGVAPGWQGIRALLGTGSWITLSNVVGPLMVSLDRFVIASVASTAVVAYYTAPYEAVTKLWLIPAALTGVLFPAFAAAAGSGAGAERLLDRGIRATLASLLPVTFVVILLAPEGLTGWLGGEFPERSTRVVQLLAVGVLLNSVAQIPFALLQGAGRASWTAKLHLTELPVYLAVAWWLIGRWGVTGAALAWTLRCGVDAVAVLALAGRVTRVPRQVGRALLAALSWCALAGAATYHASFALRLGAAVAGSLAMFAVLVRGLGVSAHVADLRRRVAHV